MENLALLSCLLFSLHGTSKATWMACNPATVTVMESASVTCGFNTDISVAKHGFNVVLHPFNTSVNKEIDVLVCNWGEGSEKPQCIVQRGFYFDYVVTDAVTVIIPFAAKQHAGSYECHQVPADNLPLRNCTLRVKDMPVIQSDCSSQESESNGLKTMITATFVLVVITVILLCITLIRVFYRPKVMSCWQKRSTLARNTEGDNTPEGDPLLHRQPESSSMDSAAKETGKQKRTEKKKMGEKTKEEEKETKQTEEEMRKRFKVPEHVKIRGMAMAKKNCPAEYGGDLAVSIGDPLVIVGRNAVSKRWTVYNEKGERGEVPPEAIDEDAIHGIDV